MRRSLALVLIAFLVAGLAAAEDKATRHALKKGAVVDSGEATVLLSRSRDKYKHVQNAQKHDRQGQLKARKKNKQVLIVSSGTRVRVLNYDPRYSKVRILEGEYKHKTAWTATSNLKPGPPLTTEKAVSTAKDEDDEDEDDEDEDDEDEDDEDEDDEDEDDEDEDDGDDDE